jgi:hypothetical protein
MTSRRTSLAAAIFAVTFVAGLLLVNNPDSESSPATFARFYAKSGNRVHLVLSAVLLSASALAWVVTVTGLRERVGDGAAGRVASTAAAATAALIGVGGTLLAAIPAAMTFGSAPAPGVDLERFLPQAGYAALTLFAMPAAALSVTAICVAALRTAALPRWLAYLGFAASVLLLASLEFFPIVPFVVWVVATAVVLARRPLRIPLPATA